MKVLSIFKLVYAIIMISIFVIFSLAVPEGVTKAKILLNRFVVGMIFSIPGLIGLIFRKPIGKFFYNNQIPLIKNHTTEEKMTSQLVYMTSCMLITGLIIITIGIISYFI